MVFENTEAASVLDSLMDARPIVKKGWFCDTPEKTDDVMRLRRNAEGLVQPPRYEAGCMGSLRRPRGRRPCE
jgi:hypothetical protein